ncbi:hypothetical protein ACTMS0_24180 [Micromonospora sp. H33]|uniref:hypothetical protein n=1 Tax=Micromonospora sp. H33 TaxID=3452215 RepID=UPI003F8CD73F
MLAGLEVPPAVEAERVITAVLADLRSRHHGGVVVDSPPGAGKSTLVVRAAVELAAPGVPLIIVAQTNDQVDDLIDLLAQKAPELRIGRLSAADYPPSERVTGHETVQVAAKAADLGGSVIIIGTAVKWATVTADSWPRAELLDAHPPTDSIHLNVLVRLSDRWEANQSMMGKLAAGLRVCVAGRSDEGDRSGKICRMARHSKTPPTANPLMIRPQVNCER